MLVDNVDKKIDQIRKFSMKINKNHLFISKSGSE